MNKKKTIKIKENILSSNDLLAEKNKDLLNNHKVFSINIMASPGGGKTTFIDRTISMLKDDYKIGVIDGDMIDLDLKKISHHNIPLQLANTGGACHLDATMISKSLEKLPLNKLDLLIVENVGNLICPANFLLGTHKNVVLSSVPEGDDKPYKYPGMFLGADVLILNKTDYLDFEDFNMEYFEDGVKKLNENLKFFPLSAKTGDGFDSWISWLTASLTDPKR